jgi:hypothetical protein
MRLAQQEESVMTARNLRKIAAIVVALSALAGCVVYPAAPGPYYGGGYYGGYYPAPAYGVVGFGFGDGWHHHWH